MNNGNALAVVRQTGLLRSGKAIVVGTIPAGRLVRSASIPRRDSLRKTGYQREASQQRVNELVRALRANRVDLPTAILLNMRDFRSEDHLRAVRNDSAGSWMFDPDETAL